MIYDSKSKISIFFILILILICGCSNQTIDIEYDSKIIKNETEDISFGVSWKDYKDVDNDSGVYSYEYQQFSFYYKNIL